MLNFIVKDPVNPLGSLLLYSGLMLTQIKGIWIGLYANPMHAGHSIYYAAIQRLQSLKQPTSYSAFTFAGITTSVMNIIDMNWNSAKDSIQ